MKGETDMNEIDPNYRLPPERQIRLYTRIARLAIQGGDLQGAGLIMGMGVALAAIRNVQDAIARLQEHHVR
jgi:hypothetical protein